MPTTYYNLIAGERLPSSSGDFVEIRNPADIDEVIGRAPASTLDDVHAAIAAAQAAQPIWAERPAPERGRILFRAATLLEGRIEAWAVELTREEGKTLTEARGEVSRVVDILRFFAGEAWRVGGDILPADTPHTLLYSLRVPVGVCAIITPWNFPVSLPAWKMMPALVTGNTVVFKPASATPIMGIRLVELLYEAGLPKGVVNVFTGKGGALGDALATDERINAVSFTGSYSVGYGLYQKTAPRMTRTHLEMGGKNPVIVLQDADLEKAVRLSAAAGFGLTGQACTATSRVIVEHPLLQEFTERLVAVANSIRIAPGLADGAQMGPAVSTSQLQTDLEYIQIGRDEGAKVVAGGDMPRGKLYERGYFIQPTVLAQVKPDMRVAQEEIFGPVISVIEAGDAAEAFMIANNVAYGLSAAVFTNDLRRAIRFVQQAEAGMLKVNQWTSGAAVQAPFGGFKHSGSGMFREMGKGAVEFFTQIKTVYLDGQ
jgi:aldehyde dehydrogenase (NAD+)